LATTSRHYAKDPSCVPYITLERTPRDATLVENIELADKTKEYEVERVLDMQMVNNQPFYLIKWKGYDTSKNTWEPINNLINCQLLLQDFHQQ
jgi:hypothetical protein